MKKLKFSVPVWVIVIALLVVTAVAAAWLLQSLINVQATTIAQPPAPTIENAFCEVVTDAGSPGAGCTATFTGSNATLSMTDIDPGDEIYLGVSYINTDPVQDVWAPALNTSDPTFGSAFFFVDAGCGTIIPSGGTPSAAMYYYWTLDGDNSDPGTTYGPIDFELNFELADTSGSCP